MKILILILITGLLCACAVQPEKIPEPTGEWVWANEELYRMADLGQITDAELNHKFVTAKSTCKIESLKIPIPSPSCSTIPAPNCYGMSGFALGFCQGQQPYQKCDYSSVNAAKDAQFEVFESCMGLTGWLRIWQPFDEPKPMSSAATESDDTENIQEIINSVPELVQWQENDAAKWDLAISIDNSLKDLPEYKDVSVRERFLVVVEKVKSVYK